MTPCLLLLLSVKLLLHYWLIIISSHHLIAKVRNLPFELSENLLKLLQEGCYIDAGWVLQFTRRDFTFSCCPSLNSPTVNNSQEMSCGQFCRPKQRWCGRRNSRSHRTRSYLHSNHSYSTNGCKHVLSKRDIPLSK